MQKAKREKKDEKANKDTLFVFRMLPEMKRAIGDFVARHPELYYHESEFVREAIREKLHREEQREYRRAQIRKAIITPESNPGPNPGLEQQAKD